MGEAVNYSSFPLVAGQDITLTISVTDSAGAAVDLTGASARFVLSTPNDRVTVLDSADSPQTATCAVTNEAGGVVTVTITAANSAALLGDYYYEIKVTDSAGAESVTNRGIITFETTTT